MKRLQEPKKIKLILSWSETDAHNKKNAFAIPVFVDSVKKYEHFKMTRLIFFSVYYDRDRINWILELMTTGIPFIQIGVHCVIYKPLGEEPKFNSPSVIKRLFSKIRDEMFLIDTDHIFLPNYFFEEPPKRGDVYRLDLTTFQNGFRFANDLIYDDDFDKFFRGKEKKIVRDELETKIFKLWGEEKIDEEKKKHNDLLNESKETYLKHYLDWKPEPEESR